MKEQLPLLITLFTNYMNGINNYNYGITWGKFPVCSWSSDAFTNWLTQNSNNVKFQASTGGASILLGAALVGTGFGAIAGIGLIASGVSQIGNSINQVYEHSLVPPTAEGQTNAGDVTFSANCNNVLAKQMSIRSEYAQIIDNYFEMFGYKVNLLKTPNITGRPYWNYVKTIDCNVEADIPNDDLLLIRKMFDNGVTLWHTDDMYDYTKNNH